MSKDTRIALSAIPLAFIVVSSMSIRWYESFIFVGIFPVNFGQCFPTNIARFWMVGLHP